MSPTAGFDTSTFTANLFRPDMYTTRPGVKIQPVSSLTSVSGSPQLARTSGSMPYSYLLSLTGNMYVTIAWAETNLLGSVTPRFFQLSP